MKQYIPTNKTTRQEYPPISEAEKQAMESDLVSRGKYTYRAIEVKDAPKETVSKPTEQKKEKTPAPPPIEARPVNPMPEA